MKFNKKEELESYLKTESLVLIDPKFFMCFNNVNSEKKTQYNAFNNKIHIYLDNNEILSFKSNNNIISLNGNINNSIHLKQLIKIFYFQKKMKSLGKVKYNNIYLISKKVINSYKNVFNYNKLCDFLKTNPNTKNINYENLNNHYNKIVNELDDYISQFILTEEKKISSELKDINENFIELEYKINITSEKKLKYIKNFELVEKDIKDFFIKNNVAKEEHFISLNYCIAENGRILIIFDKNNNNFYEIGYFNENEDFKIEYIIDLYY